MEFIDEFINTLKLTSQDVFPIAAILFSFQLFVLRSRILHLKQVLLGFVLVMLGLTFFLEGLELSLFPIGKDMAHQLTEPAFLHGAVDTSNGIIRFQDYYWVYIFAAMIGFSTAIAEPSVIAVALKVEEVSGGVIGAFGLRIAVATGSAIGVALGTIRIVTGTPLHYYIIFGYIIVILQTMRAPRMIIPLAFDSGGVTTSTVTVPLVAALGLGLASAIPGRSPLLDGFGMIALACLFPIITVMGYAQINGWLTARQDRKNSKNHT